MNVAIILAFFFRFILVPVVLIGIMVWAWNQTDSEFRRISAFWLGILIAVLVIVVSFFRSSEFFVSLDANQPFTLEASAITTNVVIGLTLGLGSMLITRLLSLDIARAALIAALAAGSLIALYEYFFNSVVRDQVLLVALSFVIGALAYMVFGPSPKR
jgi:hypothetical protein